MSGLVSVLSVSAGTLLAIALFVILVFWYIKDITQKKHTVLRNYPIIGRLRYFFEQMGEYFRQYFFTGERDEMPFNRARRAAGSIAWPRTRAASSASVRPTTCTSRERWSSSMRRSR
jgi:hypothetical protein